MHKDLKSFYLFNLNRKKSNSLLRYKEFLLLDIYYLLSKLNQTDRF